MMTIVGGKWTTYRHMAEEAVDRAASLANLEARPCITGEIRLVGGEACDSKDLVIDSLPITWSDVEHAVTGEMAMTLDDVLNRRTRSVLLDVKAAETAAPLVAERWHISLMRERTGFSRNSRLSVRWRQPTDHLYPIGHLHLNQKDRRSIHPVQKRGASQLD